MSEAFPEQQTLMNRSEQFREGRLQYEQGLHEQGWSEMIDALVSAKGQEWPLKGRATRISYLDERGKEYHRQPASDGADGQSDLEARIYKIGRIGKHKGRPTVWLTWYLIKNVENEVLIESLSLATLEELAEVKERSLRPSNVTTA